MQMGQKSCSGFVGPAEWRGAKCANCGIKKMDHPTG